MTVRAYHLTPAVHALSNLRHRHLKIATFDDLNDPFELWAVAQPDPRLRAGLRGWKRRMAHNYGILCFSRSWDNPCRVLRSRSAVWGRLPRHQPLLPLVPGLASPAAARVPHRLASGSGVAPNCVLADANEKDRQVGRL